MSLATSSEPLIAVGFPSREHPHDDRPDQQEPAGDQCGHAVVQQDPRVAEQRILIALSPLVIREGLDQAEDEHHRGDDAGDHREPFHASSPSDGRASGMIAADVAAAAPAPAFSAAGSANGSTASAPLACRAPSDGITARATRSASTALMAASMPLPSQLDHVSVHIWYQV